MNYEYQNGTIGLGPTSGGVSQLANSSVSARPFRAYAVHLLSQVATRGRSRVVGIYLTSYVIKSFNNLTSPRKDIRNKNMGEEPFFALRNVTI